MSFLLRKRSNLYVADTSSQRTLFLGSDSVLCREVSLYSIPINQSPNVIFLQMIMMLFGFLSAGIKT